MNKHTRYSIFLRGSFALAAAIAGAVAAAAPTQLLPEQPGDLSVSTLAVPSAAAISTALPALSHDPVALSWAASDAVTVPTPYVAQSRQTYLSVTADQLAAGVAIYTTSPRAVVRLQALDVIGPREQSAIQPLNVTLTDAAGHAYANGSGMEMLAADDQLAKAGVPFATGTSAFRVHPSLGKGRFKLQVNGTAGADRYVLNVAEPDSPYTMTMQTAATHYLHGQQLTVQADLQEGAPSAPTRHAMSQLSGYVISPAGRQFPLTFAAGSGGRMNASLTLDADEAPTPGLWEVRAEATATVQGQTVLRSLRLAVPVAMPVARLDHSVTLAENAAGVGGIQLKLGVEAAAAGRYEVRGMLYGTVNGALAPLGVADAAQWLEAGDGSIALSFAPALIAQASGPFELRDLMLLDQGRMGLLHRQQRALVLSEDEIVRSGARTQPAASAQAATPAAPAPHVKRAPNAASL